MSVDVSRGVRHDVIVVGVGLAGLAAALRLAEEGGRVLVLAKGVGATHLAGGTIDILGYAPEPVASPASALPQFAAARRGHPYALLGPDAVAASVDWLKGRFESGLLGSYRYRGGLEENLLLPTATGAAKPSAVVPETMVAGDLRGGGRFCIVGFPQLKDFYPAYVADNLGRAGRDVSARAIELDLALGRVDANSLAVARRFDDPRFRAGVAAALVGRLQGDERVGFPAALGITDPHGAWSDLERRLGHRVFEIPTLPPSVPGMRMFAALRDGIRRAGGRIVIGSEVIGAERAGGRVGALHARAASRQVTYPADWVVLASGGFASGALELDSRWRGRETVLGLPVAGVPAAGEERFRPRYLDTHPLARAGVAADAELRPLDERGERVYENVLIAGATLAGAEPWREKSGDGISLASGHRAAELIPSAAKARARDARLAVKHA
jgi:glycerol-3-phosphate dehydrogenase subunit B